MRLSPDMREHYKGEEGVDMEKEKAKNTAKKKAKKNRDGFPELLNRKKGFIISTKTKIETNRLKEIKNYLENVRRRNHAHHIRICRSP